MADYKQRSQEYAQKLKDPRWQKKRLEILERDEWTCQLCGSTTDTLAVHHKRYLIDTEPWDYPNKLLITLCETCHEAEKEGGESNDLIAMVKENFLSNDITESSYSKAQSCSAFLPLVLVLHILWSSASMRSIDNSDFT